MIEGISKERLEQLLLEKKDMCNCGCGWGEEDGHEWEILLLERLLKEEVVELKDNNE